MTQATRVVRLSALTIGAVAAAAALVACSKKHDATQSAARVDGTDITVHEINYRLARERGLRPDQKMEASRRILEQLIDQQLFVDKATKDKLDKDPDAQQMLAAARRDVLAHAYIDQARQGVAAPTEDALRRYYGDNPALFSDRRVYTLHEYLTRVPVAQQPELKAIIDGGKPDADVTAWLKARNLPYRDQEGSHPAEQIPLGALAQLNAMADGHGTMAAVGDQVHVTYRVSSEPHPVTFEQARPAISQFLSVEEGRKVTDGNIAALRSAAKIEYAAPYAALAASDTAGPTMRELEASAPTALPSGTRVTLPAPGAASGVQVSLPDASGSGVRVSLPAITAPNAQVTLPSTTPGVRVSLPAVGASSVEVRLPPQTGDAATNK